MVQTSVYHWIVIKRILRYLRGTLDLGHLFQSIIATSLTLQAYSDAGWASDLDDRKSTLGACLFLDPNLMLGWIKKQAPVAKSIAEAKYQSLVLATSEVLWFNLFFLNSRFIFLLW